MTASNLATTAGTTSASFQPIIGALVVVGWTGEGSGVAPSSVTIADSLGETSFTAMNLYSPFNFAMGKVWYGVATTHTARQIILTVNGTSTANNQLVVDQIELTAVLHTATLDTSFTTTPTATFASTPASTSLVYSMMLEFAAQSQTKPATETSIVSNYQGSGIATISSAWDSDGSALQSVAWGSVGGSYVMIRAIEVSPPPPPPPPTTFVVGHIPIT